ncbi:MAG TPA: hypothetical protein VM791_08755 [Vicinamibacterales bacterium]|nr:hypothetical protein [Vicinamibacterales bacterium]
MLKRVVACAIGAGVLISAPGMASAQTRERTISEVTLRGTVQSIDHDARTVTIQGDKGRVVTLDVPPSITRFDQVKVGDIVTLSYYDRVSVRLKQPGEAAVDQVVPPTTTPTPGALPGATRARQRMATVTITAWDPATRTVTFTGPKGGTYARVVSETLDPTIVQGLKVGDRADITWTEALSLQVTSGTPAEDEFRHRFTLSVQYGVDNQFSGDMIKEASGATTGGAPINLEGTSFDEVYGRIAMFKIGVGYRTTPRTEAVVNWVYSKSDAEDAAIPIGTVGGSIPLDVNFTEYKYWGIEAGQRWYFARTRFTPYLGYLVGVNRHQEIRGTFVGVPIDLTPGLAAQDGKFFDKSWAFSLGPTGGVLIGVGPIEIMGEVQLRYIGGLSDVDWLVEEGLQDINDDSARWSFPLLVGARIRF